MASPTKAQLATARGFLARAAARFNGAAAAVARPNPTEGEFDNNFDGVVTGIFHVVDAFELITAGLRRETREAEQATRIRSAVLALGQAGVPDVPAATRLVGLNARRNTSVHGEWLKVLDPDALLDAIKAGRLLLAAVERYAKDHGLAL
ncbi:MAG TPA: hypothetical protein VF337_05750 [Candidatus Limnocylindrales bacterium]